jgi:hypothetical protein
MENNAHRVRRLRIFSSNSRSVSPMVGFSSSSASRRCASARPPSGSENNPGKESKMCMAKVALWFSGSSNARVSTVASVVIVRNYELVIRWQWEVSGFLNSLRTMQSHSHGLHATCARFFRNSRGSEHSAPCHQGLWQGLAWASFRWSLLWI